MLARVRRIINIASLPSVRAFANGAYGASPGFASC
jgi:hypothetical protein